jgi:hypothetical protein
MILDPTSPGCGASAWTTAGSGEPSILSNQPWLEVDHKLQKAMYVAMEQLQMLWRFYHDPRHSSQIRADITAVARWINFLLDQRDHIAIEITRQKPDLVKLGGRLVCETCRKDAKDNCSNSSHEDSAPAPIWKMQLEFLLACTERVGTEVFEQDCSSYSLRNFPDCLTKLLSALLRQRRCLISSMGARETGIEVDHGSNSCAECGQTISPLPAAVP